MPQTLNLRNVPDDVARRFRAGAAALGLSLPAYLELIITSPPWNALNADLHTEFVEGILSERKPKE